MPSVIFPVLCDLTMSGSSDASKVLCRGDGLTLGYIRHPIEAFIDTRLAGPGKLTNYGDTGNRARVTRMIMERSP